MEDELELGKSYTIDSLLNFLSQNYRQNIFLVSTNVVDLTVLPRDKELIVSDIQSIFLHKFTKPDTYIKNTETKLYHLKQV